MKTRLLGASCAVILLSTMSAAFGELQVTFTKLYDTNTVIPGRSQTFRSMGPAALDPELGVSLLSDGSIAFIGNGREKSYDLGLYTDIGGTLVLVADTNTPVPNGTGTFDWFFSAPWLDGGQIAFNLKVKI